MPKCFVLQRQLCVSIGKHANRVDIGRESGGKQGNRKPFPGKRVVTQCYMNISETEKGKQKRRIRNNTEIQKKLTFVSIALIHGPGYL